MKKLKFHYDSGHGWLEVPKTLFINIIGKECDSGYSYEDKDNYYLEEDCDAPEFLKVYLGDNPKEWNKNIIEINDGDNSFIRGLNHIKL